MERKLLAGLLFIFMMVAPMLAIEIRADSIADTGVILLNPNGPDTVNGTVNLTANVTAGQFHRFQFVEWWWSFWGGPANYIGQTNVTACNYTLGENSSYHQCSYSWNTTGLKNTFGYMVSVTAFFDVVMGNETIEQDVMLGQDSSDLPFNIMNS